MRRANIYPQNEPKVMKFVQKYQEQTGESISFDRGVNIMIENIEKIEETRTLIVTLKAEPDTEQKPKRKRIKRTSNFVTDFRL